MTVDASAVARVTGVDTQFRDLRNGSILLLPQRIAVFAQGNTTKVFALDKFRAYSSKQVGDALGFGSPAHLIARELFPDSGKGVGTIPVTFYPLEDAEYAVASTGRITPTGSQTKAGSYRVRIAGILSQAFVIAIGDSIATVCDKIVAAVNAVTHMPMTATDNATYVGFAAKWAGVSSNDLVIEVIGDASLGTTFTVLAPSGGLVNPDVDTALTLVGPVWETLLINALDADDTTVLDAFQTFGEGRWTQTVPRPCLVFRGCQDDTVTLATSATATRTDDRVNVQIPAPDSPNLPGVIAAAAVVEIAKLANNNPPHDYGSRRLRSLVAGDDSVQWTEAERDAAVKAGSSATEIKDGVVCLSDVVTSWAPTGEAVPAYRFVVDIIKLMQIQFNLDLIFGSDDWDGAPLIPDDQVTTNPAAKKPKHAIAAVNGMIDSLGLAAIISDPKTAKEQTTAVIGGSNPKRLNVTLTVQLSGNTNIKDATLYWGFYFGEAAAAA